MSKPMTRTPVKSQTPATPPPATICKDCIHGSALFDCEQQTRNVVTFGPAHDIRFAVLSCSAFVQVVKKPEKEAA